MLDEDTRDGLISLGELREYPLGHTFFITGARSRHVFALLSGWVKVVDATAQGGRSLLAIGSCGDLIGEQAAIEGKPRSATVVCASVVMAYDIRPEPFLQFLKSHPDAHLAVTQSLSIKLRTATRRQVDFSGAPITVRLARVLGELARRNSQPAETGTEVGYALSQTEIAALVGVSEPTIQRALRELRNSDVLDTGYRKITIRDMAALNRIAGADWSAG